VRRALEKKENFNEREFMEKLGYPALTKALP